MLVSSNWIDLELKNSHSASSCSPGSRGQRLSLNLLPTHCGQCRRTQGAYPAIQVDFGSHPCRAHLSAHCTCGRIHCVNTSSATRHLYLSRSTSRCTMQLYVTSAPVVDVNAPASCSVRVRLRLPWSTSRQHKSVSHAAPARVPMSTLCASACILCRTCCDCNRWLRFSPCRAHRLHLHLSSLTVPSVYVALVLVVDYIAPAPSVYRVFRLSRTLPKE